MSLVEWIFIETDQAQVEEYAPTAIVVGDNIYYFGFSTEWSRIFWSADPFTGAWSFAHEQKMPV